MSFGRYLTLAASGLGVFSAVPVMAQTASASGSAGGAEAVSEVVVTARRREERLQEVPLAVTAVSAKTFERQQIQNIEGLHLSIPNLTVVRNTTTTNAAQIYIRGIGQDESTYNSEQGVAVYIDGVPLGKQNGALLDLIEFERIEVLRGPQGTLYGRNATGGAVKFVTKKPDLTTFRGAGDLAIGRFGRFDVRGTLSVPIISDELAVKFDFVSRSEDGFVRDLTLDEDINNLNRKTARVSALWEPTDAFSAYVTLDKTWDRSNINVPIPTQLRPACIRSATNPTPACNGQDRDDFAPRFGSERVADRSIPNLNTFDGGGGSVQLDYDFGPVALSSTTGYRELHTEFFPTTAPSWNGILMPRRCS